MRKMYPFVFSDFDGFSLLSLNVIFFILNDSTLMIVLDFDPNFTQKKVCDDLSFL